MTKTYTHPDVFTVGVRDGWADPITDPTRIDWPARQAAALIPFTVTDGRPVNPFAPTGIEHGRNELGHWGEAVAADALVEALDPDGCRWIVMVERKDGHGWALPGGMVDPGESPTAAAIRELAEETTLDLSWGEWRTDAPRYVPDPRASDEAWIVTVLSRCHLGTYHPDDRDEVLPVVGADDAARAAWVHADNVWALIDHLAARYGGQVFPAHRQLLADVLTPVEG
ncbi:NUDIX domain-containing protein [Dactylosporangium sp. NPDC000521]|uniref:NUDIX domain-containing protein n=1 Tax=Dactylosporangium sp. NPDC000521 TaxID=3363975 RepID=UPI0036CA5F58